MMENKEKIKLRIRALLNKTVENGATEAEAIAALRKANELMVQYYISEHDLKDPFAGEKITLKETSLIKSGYDLTFFYPFLAQLFDCEYFYNPYRIAFFGFQEDVQLCDFFYTLIVKACLREKDRYMKSKEFKSLKQVYHGKTLAASFIKGFLLKVSDKMNEMYKNRKSTVPENMGLVLVQKSERVKSEYKKLDLTVRSAPTRKLEYERIAFSSGVTQGNNFHITQGINQYQSESQIKLNPV